MKVYFSVDDLPELAGLSEAERDEIWRAAVGKAWSSWRVLVVLAIFLSLYTLGIWVFYGPLHSYGLKLAVISGVVFVSWMFTWPFLIAITRPLISEEQDERKSAKASMDQHAGLPSSPRRRLLIAGTFWLCLIGLVLAAVLGPSYLRGEPVSSKDWMLAFFLLAVAVWEWHRSRKLPP